MDVHALKLWINFPVKREVKGYVREHLGHRDINICSSDYEGELLWAA